MKEIQKYEPQIVVTLKNGRVLFFPEKLFEGFKDQIKDKSITHIDIEGVGVNKYLIETYEKMPVDYDILLPLSQELRDKMVDKIRSFKERLGKTPNRAEKQHMLKRIVERQAQENNY